MMKRFFLSLLWLVVASNLWAYDCYVGGIYYDLNTSTNEAEVTTNFPNKYSGSIIIPSSFTYSGKTYNVISICDRAFEACTSLTAVTIPTGVSSIGNYAFSNCTKLSSITIPSSVTSIGYSPFSYCVSLSSISVASGNAVYDSRDNCNAIIKKLNNELIVGCKNTVIPSSVTSVGERAFFGCTGLTSIVIPDNVTSIGDASFCSCRGLISITVCCVEPPTIVNTTYGGINSSIPIYVPSSSLQSYRSAPFWSDFTNFLAGRFYIITVDSNNDVYGIVTGGGMFVQNSSATLTATPKAHYHFVQWNDGITSNPRTITVIGDKTYTATFAIDTYTLTVNSNNTTYGTVTGGGTYAYNSSVTLQATPKANYLFLKWSDGNMSNPRTVTVTGNKTYTASFVKEVCTLTVNSNNTVYGTVSGGGTYTYNSSATLTATAKPHYHFVQWSDGNTSNPRAVTVTGDKTYTATFAIDTHTLTANSNNTAYGTVSGGGTYDYNSTVTLTATPKAHYHFVQWNDGITSNPRTITVIGDKTYTATFAIDTHALTVNSNNTSYGTVTGGGTYTYNSSATLTATPKAHCHFVCWDDNDTSATRTVVVTEDKTYMAYFDENLYTLTVNSSNTAYGTVSGGGKYVYGRDKTLTASPKAHCHFVCWDDGDTNNPRTVTVTGDKTYTATFAIDTHALTVNSNNTSYGTVTGGGTYAYNSYATLVADPAPGYVFYEWSDGADSNPHVVLVEGDMNLTAYFHMASGIHDTEDDSLRAYAKEGVLYVENAGHEYRVWTASGVLLYVGSESAIELPYQGICIISGLGKAIKVLCQ